jgi:putative resolvase
MSDPPGTVLVVQHRDRLARLWVEHVHAGPDRRRIMVAGIGDLVRDRIDVVTPMCVRRYERRAAQDRALGAMIASGFQPEPSGVVS